MDEALATLVSALADAPPEKVIEVHAQLKDWGKVMKDVENITKGYITQLLADYGTKTTEKGSLAAEVGGYVLEMRPTRTGLDAKKVESLLRAKELDVDLYMDKTISYALNETRLAAAVKSGTLTEDEIETCRYQLSYSLQPPKKVTHE